MEGAFEKGSDFQKDLAEIEIFMGSSGTIIDTINRASTIFRWGPCRGLIERASNLATNVKATSNILAVIGPALDIDLAHTNSLVAIETAADQCGLSDMPVLRKLACLVIHACTK